MLVHLKQPHLQNNYCTVGGVLVSIQNQYIISQITV
jgi:hypothetical protein